MRDYGKVHTCFWSSETTRAMSEDGRALALYLLTCSHGTLAGIFRVPDGYICEDMQWSVERVQQTLSELLAKGFANRCETTKWVWIIKHLEWNPPENPNQRKAAVKLWTQVPDGCVWKADYHRDCGEIIGLDPLPKEEPLPNPSETLSKPVAVAVAVTEESQHISSPGGDPMQCPVTELISLYHSMMPNNPRLKVLTEARRSAIKARWREAAGLSCKPFGYSDRVAGLSAWEEFFSTCAESPFLTGRAKPQPGKPAFFADIDFLMSPSGFAKCIENKYHREAA